MRLLMLISFFIIMQASSCNREEPVIIQDKYGVITDKPVLWKTPVSEKNTDATSVRNGIKYNKTAVIGSWKNNRDGFSGIDIDTGEKVWEWYDDFGNYTLDIYRFYIYGKYLAFVQGRELYCVDLLTGNTVWKKRFEAGNDPLLKEVNGIGTEFFVLAGFPYPGNKTYPQSVRIYKTSVTDGPVLEEIIEIAPGNYVNIDGIATYGWEVAAFRSNTGDTLIFTDTTDPVSAIANDQTKISLYNLTRQKWIYKKKVIKGVYSGSVDKPKLHKGIVYMAMSPYIVAIDLMTGKPVWKWYRERAGYGTSGFILVPEKNLIVFNAEASGTILYALDMVTGNIVWQEPSSGTSSRLQYLNGVIYFVGGGDGLLHAVDVDTGRHLWKIRSPDEAVNSNAWFARYCAAFPGQNGQKGRIVVTSGLNAFAYEAVR